MKQPSSASHKFQMIKSKKIEPSPIQKQFQHYLGNQSSRQYSTQKSKEKVEIPNDSKMILKTQNNGSIGERRKPDPNNGSLTDRTSLKNRTLSTQSRIQASPIRVRPLTTKELIQHKDPPRKQQVQPQQTRTLTPQSPQKIAVVTPKPQQQSLTNKFKPAYQRGTALPFKVTTNTPSTSNLDSSTISTRSMQQKPSRDEKSKSMYKKPLSQSQLTSPRAKTPQSNNKNFEPLYSIVRPIFKEANYYQTSLFHFHHELMKNQQSPFHFYYTLEYSTEELRKYFKDIYQEHFAQNFNCLQYCKRFQEKKQNLKIVKLENSSVPQQCKSKIIRTVIFDLDETLIHCNDNNNDPTDHTILVKLPYENAVETRINIRPYCQQMLKLLSQHYELMLFTASYSYYADKVLEIIDPDKTIFKYRFYRESCLELEDGLFIKDLRVLGNRNLDNVILVDNAAYSYCYQLDNGVPIIPFYDNKYDKELIFLTDYLLSLEKQPQWLYQNKIQFRNYLYQQCSSSEECMTELFKVHNQY